MSRVEEAYRATSHYRRTGLWLLLLLCLVPHLLRAQGKGYGIEARALSASVLEAEPGQILTVQLQVSAPASRPLDLIDALDMPDGWNLITPLLPFTLPPDRPQTRLLAFIVPHSAPSGRYELAYSIHGQRNLELRDTESIVVQVRRMTKLELVQERTPDLVVAGAQARLDFQVINRGNTPIRVALGAETEPGCSADFAPATLTLPVRGSASTSLILTTDPRIAKPTQTTVRIQAKSINEGEAPGAVENRVVIFEVIPQAGKATDLYRRLPAVLKVSGLATRSALGYQLEAQTSGYLNTAHTRSVELELRGPDASTVNQLGLKDEYHLNLAGPVLEMRAGDQVYALSRLLDAGRYGRGLELRVHPGVLDLGAYYSMPRLEVTQPDRAGAHLGLKLEKRFALKLNALYQGAQGAGHEVPFAFTDRFLSLETEIRPFSQTRLALEYGRSGKIVEDRLPEYGYRLEGESRLADRLSLSFARIYASPDFDAYYRDVDLLRGTGSLRLRSHLALTTSFQSYRRNLDLRVDRRLAPDDRTFQIGFTCSAPVGWCMSGTYDVAYSRDLLQTGHDTREDTLHLKVGRADTLYNFYLEANDGLHYDRATGQRGFVQHYGAFGAFQPDPKHSLGLTAWWTSRPSGTSGTHSSSASLGTTLRWQFGDAFDVRVKYVFNLAQVTQQRLELRTRLELPRMGAVELAGRYDGASATQRKDWAGMLSYARTFGVPVGRREDVGSVYGRLYDRETTVGRGLAGVVLSLGGTLAITDREGRFTFAAVPPGQYPLGVERRSLGMNRVLLGVQPLRVEVKKGQATRIEVEVAQGVRISGRVQIVAVTDENGTARTAMTDLEPGMAAVAQPPGAAGEGSGVNRMNAAGLPSGVVGNGEPVEIAGTGLPNIMIELTRGKQVVRRLTDQNGSFVAEDLPPGTWALKVWDQNLPEYHYVDHPERTLELSPGASQDVQFQVKPKVRRIQMIDGGELRMGAAPASVPNRPVKRSRWERSTARDGRSSTVPPADTK